ncbi:MAG: hypothetical protein A2Y53_03800 [Chloroflexi bacterium RBG_16_47_49]|nr:MAG: hypothetical protein A2Y53_03800 [Chloroflexi bacterium RBG_16_47_49]
MNNTDYTESNKPVAISPYTLVIPEDKYRILIAYARGIQAEISGFADVTLDKTAKTLTIGDIYLLSQTVTGAHTDLSEKTVSKFTVEQIKAGKTQLPRLWWHSHYNFGVFFSGTDKNTYTETLNNGTWSVSLVINQAGDTYAVLTVYEPFIAVYELPVKLPGLTIEVPDSIKSEIANKVKKTIYELPTYKPPKGRAKWSDYNFDSKAGIYVGSKYYAKTRSLPKKTDKARKLVNKLGLLRQWSYDYKTYVYPDPVKDIVYIDTYFALSELTADKLFYD